MRSIGFGILAIVLVKIITSENKTIHKHSTDLSVFTGIAILLITWGI